MLQYCNRQGENVYIYVCMYVCMYYIYVYINTHTHTHTHIYIYIYIYSCNLVIFPSKFQLKCERHGLHANSLDLDIPVV